MSDSVDARGPIALLLLDIGGPDSLEAVRPYLENAFADPMAVSIPFGSGSQRMLAKLLAWHRSKDQRRAYARIGGRSPVGPATEQFGCTLADEVSRRTGRSFRAYAAFRHWHPFIREALDRARADGCRRIVGLSMFPQYCRATSGSCVLELRRRAEELPDLDLSFIDRFPKEPDFLEALAECVRDGLATWPGDVQPRVHVIFIAQAHEQSTVGDSYGEELEGTVAGVVERLPPTGGWLLAFQSRAGGAAWLQPSLEGAIARLAAAKVADVLAVPVGFLSDRLETLHHLDILCAEHARAKGIANLRRAPTPCTRPSLVRALAGLVERHLVGVEAVRKEVP